MHVRVCILIPTRALPPMSYRVPDDLAGQVQVGSAVVVPLSGYSRLGIVAEVGETSPDRPLEEVRRVAGGLSLGPELVGLCDWVSENSALPRPVVLRNALPPGLRIELYRVVAPAPDWSWRRGSLVERSALRKSLGKDGLKEAEAGGRVALSPAPARRESVEWVVPGESEPSLARAPRQRELFEKILSRGTCRVRSLLEETGARRETLKSLADRGAVRIERRSGASPVIAARGTGETPRSGVIQELPERGRYLWRVSGEEEAMAVAGLCRAAVKRWEQALVLAPEVRDVERLVSELAGLLPAGTTIAPYHSGLGRERAAVYEAVRQGAVDVLVGTRAAALLPLSRPGAICVVDEPNPAHRAEPGFEGIPLHVRELALERGSREGAAVLLLSPAPSLALYTAARSGEVRELPATEPASWPEARVVDMRGSGAAVGRDLVEACREGMVEEGGVGVVVNRLGYATAVSCAQCGVAVACGSCGLPLVLHGGSGTSGMGELRGEMVCHQCAARAAVPRSCSGCGSERLVPTGLAVERVRDLLAERLGGRVGLATAERHSRPDARVIVGTAHEILAKSWDTVLVPDADSLLLGGGVLAAERGFRALYSAAASARRRVAVQTRDPENAVLEAALRGDYPAFAALELPRRRRAGYPPYRHLAALTLEGEESAVRRAVESVLRLRESSVEALEPVLLADGTRADAWRVVLRARRRSDLARAVSLAAELPSSGPARGAANGSPRGEARRIQIELDPEEV